MRNTYLINKDPDAYDVFAAIFVPSRGCALHEKDEEDRTEKVPQVILYLLRW